MGGAEERRRLEGGERRLDRLQRLQDALQQHCDIKKGVRSEQAMRHYEWWIEGERHCRTVQGAAAAAGANENAVTHAR